MVVNGSAETEERRPGRRKGLTSETVWTMLVAESTPESEVEEARLVAAARDGDGDAFGELVRRHQQRVFRLAGRFFRRREEVEDVAQETFVRAWEKLSTYRAKAPFEHWLTRICLNCCYGRFRKRRGEEMPLEHDPARASADPTARVEAERLLSRLASEDRFVLLLLHGEGWSISEIAERLGWSSANVKVRAHRARKRLRRVLEEDST
jgi:RNA polymerase sigma-70 factor (ECF subfamily)